MKIFGKNLPTLVNYWILLTFFYQFLPIFTNFYQFLPIFTNFYQFLPIFTNFYKKFPRVSCINQLPFVNFNQSAVKIIFLLILLIHRKKPHKITILN